MGLHWIRLIELTWLGFGFGFRFGFRFGLRFGLGLLERSCLHPLF